MGFLQRFKTTGQQPQPASAPSQQTSRPDPSSTRSTLSEASGSSGGRPHSRHPWDPRSHYTSPSSLHSTSRGSPMTSSSALPSPTSSTFHSHSQAQAGHPTFPHPLRVSSSSSITSKATSKAEPSWKRLFGKNKDKRLAGQDAIAVPPEGQDSSRDDVSYRGSMRSRQSSRASRLPLPAVVPSSSRDHPPGPHALSRVMSKSSFPPHEEEPPSQKSVPPSHGRSKSADFKPKVPVLLPSDPSQSPKQRPRLSMTGTGPYIDYTRTETFRARENTVLVRKSDAQGEVEENGIGRMSEEMEVLESAEKKQKFWRRLSKLTSEVGDQPEPESPTPVQTTFPQSAFETGKGSSADGQSRPLNARRPSSIFKSFQRTASRTSMVVSGDGDDGSFQLKSFRHVSGVFDVEGAGDLENYLSHVPRGSSTAVSPEPASPTFPPSAFNTGPRANARPQISRPPSVAGSLASLDSVVPNSNKISAAAFRRGIRRQSEGASTTMSDIGHGARDHDDDGGDDDVPLGHMRSRPRVTSTVSLYSMREATPADERAEAKKPVVKDENVVVGSSEPSALRRHRRTPSGFLVKGSTTSRMETGGPSGDDQVRRGSRDCSVSPTLSRSLSPQGRLHPALAFDPKETIVSPTAKGGNDHLPPGSLSQTPSPNKETKPVPAHVRPPSIRPAPPVAPIALPQKEELPSAILNLPLPPDQMPDEEPSTARRDGQNSGMFQEPMRVISGLWTWPAVETADDPLDTNFILKSLAYGEGPDPKRSKAPGRVSDPVVSLEGIEDQGVKEEKEPVTAAVARPLSRASLVSNEPNGPRSAISDRLAQVASNSCIGLGLPRALSENSLATKVPHSGASSRSPPLENIVQEQSTLSTACPRQLFTMEPRVVSAPVSAVSPVSSSFPRATAGEDVKPSRLTNRLWGKAAWSSSESEGEDEHDAKNGDRQASRSSSRRVPSGPRRQPGSRQRQPLAVVSPGKESSSEDESLSVLRARTSGSDLATGASGNRLVSSSKPKPWSRGDHSPESATDSAAIKAQTRPRDESKSSPAQTRPVGPAKVRPGSFGSGTMSGTTESEQNISTPSDTALTLRSDSGVVSITTPTEGHIGGQSRTYQPTAWPGFEASIPMPPPTYDTASAMAAMKQVWQAQYLAAAYRASEEEWERASAVSGTTDQQPVLSGMPFMPHLGMPYMPHGYPPMAYGSMQRPPMGLGMGMGMSMGMPWAPPFPLPPGGMHGYGSGSQSVYGGEYSPPPALGLHQSFTGGAAQSEYKSPTPSSPLTSFQGQAKGHGRYRPPSRGDGNEQALQDRPPSSTHPEPFLKSVSPPLNWRDSVADSEAQWDDAPTPRKNRQWAFMASRLEREDGLKRT